jgi:hypothetical protein
MDTVVEALHSLASLTSADLVIALVLSGTLTMAVIQIIKDMTAIRRHFQQNWIKWWLGKQAKLYDTANSPDVDKAEAFLIALATGGDTYAFYDLAAEQLVAQMSAAAQITLDYPKNYDGLIKVLAAGADRADIANVCSVASPRTIVAQGTLPADYTDARSRVGHRIQRNLDGLQISMSDRWQLWLQWASLVISTVVIEVAILWQVKTAPTGSSLFLGLLIGILGGYLAPVVRDLVAALQSLRNP